MLLSLLAVVVSLGSSQERKPPEFRSDARLIRLDVSVVDGRGRAVAGLLQDDFAVTEDGRPVEITYFEAIETQAPVTAEAPEAEPPSLPAPPLPRRFVLLVDTDYMSHGQRLRARESAARYLREATAAGDWVRLVDMASGRIRDGWIPEDRASLEASARTLGVRGLAWGEAAADQSIVDEFQDEAVPGLPSETRTYGQFLSLFSQASGLLGTLESLFVQLQGVEGRKAVVLISPGFPALRNFDRRLERVASLAREAAAAVYFVDVVGLDGLLPEPGQKLRPVFEMAWNRSGGSQDLAEATGGVAFRFANSLLPALSKIGAEMRTYYMLGYVPSRPDDGRFRSVRVKVGVPGVTARTKKGYLAGGGP